MDEKLTFQEAIMRLERFWAEKGCLIWQPYSEKVGAGTMNPATFLMVLGPEPWRVAYVEPSYRPADGRYGENPNRMQMHTQYQVILKPDPGNPQELYLESLEALGIDPRKHDIRFVEDNWESPALGAWGLGWEVWLDGQEITQFTYFQQAGGIDLDPVSVEITYGLERIMLPLQGARGFAEIEWSDGISYGDILLRSEVERCIYNFEQADVTRLVQLYNLYEAEAHAALERGLVLPAYDYLLRCSHTFNVLDARGAIGVTERASYFARMRSLARAVAEAYLKQREEMGYPRLRKRGVRSHAPRVASVPLSPRSPVPLLLEIGTEELPARDLSSAIDQLRELTPRFLSEARLDHGRVRVAGTPRRLVVYIEEVSPKQRDKEELVKGPPAAIAFDDSGQPTKAALGFARSIGVAVEDLQVRELEGGRYVTAVRVEKGKPSIQVLSELMPRLIASLHFDMTMRWNETNVAFPRPIRWLVALLGDQVIDFEYAGVRTGRTTRGLRPLGSPEITIERASDYFPLMKANSITVDMDERRASLADQLQRLAAEVGGEVPHDPELLDEVANLVEYPTALRGSFDPRFLKLPKEVLITVMREHQRYFPVARGEGQGVDSQFAARSLLPYFIAVCNGERESLDLVRQGNEEVLRARFADAEFFYSEDTKRRLEEFLPGLATLTFQEKLGSMLDKVERIAKLVAKLGQRLGLSDTEMEHTLRAARLCKADLATKMVIEFTSLQGVMGRYYALQSGEDPAVAQAIYEHYLPRFAGDELPKSRPGIVIGLADRLDSLTGLFALGLKPTGSADPYSLRRAALGIVQILIERGISFDLEEGLREAAGLLPVPAGENVQAEVLSFIRGRLRGWLLDAGYRYDLVDAVLAERGHDPYLAFRTIADLARWVERDDWTEILTAYSRSARIVRGFKPFSLDPSKFAEPATERLYEAYLACQAQVSPQSAIDELFTAFKPLVEPINTFFEDVLVMAEDRELRENRLALLQRIASLTKGIVDLTKVEGF